MMSTARVTGELEKQPSLDKPQLTKEKTASPLEDNLKISIATRELQTSISSHSSDVTLKDAAASSETQKNQILSLVKKLEIDVITYASSLASSDKMKVSLLLKHLSSFSSSVAHSFRHQNLEDVAIVMVFLKESLHRLSLLSAELDHLLFEIEANLAKFFPTEKALFRVTVNMTSLMPKIDRLKMEIFDCSSALCVKMTDLAKESTTSWKDATYLNEATPKLNSLIEAILQMNITDRLFQKKSEVFSQVDNIIEILALSRVLKSNTKKLQSALNNYHQELLAIAKAKEPEAPPLALTKNMTI